MPGVPFLVFFSLPVRFEMGLIPCKHHLNFGEDDFQLSAKSVTLRANGWRIVPSRDDNLLRHALDTTSTGVAPQNFRFTPTAWPSEPESSAPVGEDHRIHLMSGGHAARAMGFARGPCLGLKSTPGGANKNDL